MKTSYRLSEAAFRLDGKMPLKQAIPLGLQHVLLLKGGRSCAGVHTITAQHVPMTSATPNHDRPTQIHQRE